MGQARGSERQNDGGDESPAASVAESVAAAGSGVGREQRVSAGGRDECARSHERVGASRAERGGREEAAWVALVYMELACLLEANCQESEFGVFENGFGERICYYVDQCKCKYVDQCQ